MYSETLHLRCRDLYAAVGLQCFYTILNIFRGDFVVAVEKYEVFSGGMGGSRIAGARKSVVLCVEEFDARIAPGVTCCDFGDVVGRAVVNDYGLPVRICLGQ